MSAGSAAPDELERRGEPGPLTPVRHQRRRSGYAALVSSRTLEIVDARRRTSVARGRGMLVGPALAIGDVVGLLTAFLLAELLFGQASAAADRVDTRIEFAVFALTIPGWILAARIYGLYEHDQSRPDHSTVDEFVDVFHLVTIGAWVFFAFCSATSLADPYLPKLLGFWALAVALVSTGRAAARALSRRSVAYVQNALIVGAGDVGQLVASKLVRHPEYGINVIGFVDSEPKERLPELAHLMILGDSDSVPDLIRLFDVERIIVAFSRAPYTETLKLIRAMKRLKVHVDIVPRFFEETGATVPIHAVEGVPMVALSPLRFARSAVVVKRLCDVVLACVGLVLLAPLFAIVAAAVRLDSDGPAFYRDERIGRNGSRFRLLKFRTFTAEYCPDLAPTAEAAHKAFDELLAANPALRREFELTHKLRDDPRMTRIGNFLRRTSLDELPQLLNVLRGEISLVGPRAITVYEQSRLQAGTDAAEISGYWDIGEVRPGVTGYWQINGRSAVTYSERVRLDMAYVTSWSLGLDLRILAKTARVLLSRSGAY